MPITRPTEILIRNAYADDELALRRLASLDSARKPPAPLLVAELDGELKVALSLRDGTVIADPFTYTADVVKLLRLRADDAAPVRRRPRAPSRRLTPALRS